MPSTRVSSGCAKVGGTFEPLRERVEVAMFTPPDEGGYRDAVAGVRFKALAFGERTLLGEFRFRRGALIPAHSHPHEQTGYLVSGRLVFTVAGDRLEAVPGTSWCIPSGVEHAAEAMEDSVVIEVFSPPREDYLPEPGP